MTDTTVTDYLAMMQRSLTPTQLFAVFEGMPQVVRETTYPRLLVGETVGEDGEDTQVMLRCPHCHEITANEQTGEGLVIEDISFRWTRADEIDPSTTEVNVFYGDTSEYEGLVYRCGECLQPVSLPEGWTERAI